MVEIDSLRPGKWLSQSVIDVYLTKQLIYLQQDAEVLYLHYDLVRGNSHTAEQDEINLVANLYGPLMSKAKPIVFLHWHRDHYSVIAFDYEGRRCVTYGREYLNVTKTVVKDKLVDSQMALWDRVAALMALGLRPLPPSVYSIQWKQVSRCSVSHIAESLLMCVTRMV